MLEKGQGRVDWSRPARLVSCHTRGVDPWPGAFTTLDGEALKLWRPRLDPGGSTGTRPAGAFVTAPGTVLGASPDGLLVACGPGGAEALAIGELQLPGRKRLPAAALLAGRPIPAGTVLGTEPGAKDPAGA